MKRIWFNHWFSTVYHLINLIVKDEKDKYTIIGTNERDFVAYKCACDQWYSEPIGLDDDEYVEFCLSFCKEHKIDIFAPRKKMIAISKAHKKFESIGVKLLVDSSYEIIEMLEDKAQAYEYFKEKIPSYIPEYRVAYSYDEFIEMYEELQKTSPRVCYKLISDEGARSFRVIDNTIESGKGIFEKPGTKITIEATKKVLSQYDFSVPMLLMPYLSGVEVSVDCLSTCQGSLIIPRFKNNKRYSEIIFDKELMHVCDEIMNTLKLKHPMNIQFKMDGDRYYLLEINTRMSGGLQLSCEASEINLPKIAIKELLGEKEKWSYPSFNSRKVVHIETPIRLD